MAEKIEIALAADGSYFDQLFVTATSMAAFCRSNVILSFHILDGGIATNDWDYLVRKTCQLHESCFFDRIAVNEKLFADFPKWNGNRMAYARLLLPAALKNADWVLYSDCDFLWLNDVAQLWKERDDEFYVVAVNDEGSWEKKEKEWFPKHGYSIDGNKYFCSGMCVFNLKRFRNEDLVKKIWEFLLKHPDANYPDQAALNFVCAGLVKIVPRKWMCFTYQLTQDLFANHAVLHMAGEVPWRFVRKFQLLSDTMLMWHDFNAQVRDWTRWKSLRKNFSPVQILWHRSLVWLARFPLTRLAIQVLCSLLAHNGAFKYLVIRSRRYALHKSKAAVVQIMEDRGSVFHAGPKAPRDVATILSQIGVCGFHVRRPDIKGHIGKAANRFIWWFKCRYYRWKLPRNIVLVVQYPSAGWSKYPALRVLNQNIKTRKSIKLIVVIHDLSSFRVAGESIVASTLYEEETSLFALADKLIVHNRAMMNALAIRGVPKSKLIALDLFDYLTEELSVVSSRKPPCKQFSVAIAGNLNAEKCGYLVKLNSIPEVVWHLYGINFDASRVCGKNIKYEGAWAPEELTSHLSGSFGLVWDGMDVDSCTGAYGEYMRINNPHKLSLYLAAGMPAVVWKEAAIADFVAKEHIGICVSSLRDIPTAIESVSGAEYSLMCANCMKISGKVKRGDYTKRALETALNDI